MKNDLGLTIRECAKTDRILFTIFNVTHRDGNIKVGEFSFEEVERLLLKEHKRKNRFVNIFGTKI